MSRVEWRDEVCEDCGSDLVTLTYYQACSLETEEMMSVLELLEALGNTADEVAASLKAKGIKGVPGLPPGCPLALYLQKETGDESWNVGVNNATDSLAFVPLPKGSRAFRDRFDRYGYPEMVGR